MPTTEKLLAEPAHYKELRQTGILPEHIIIGTAKHAANKFVRSRRLPRAYDYDDIFQMMYFYAFEYRWRLDPKFQFAQQVKYLLRYLELKSNQFVDWTKAAKRKGEFATPVYLSQIPLRGIWNRKKNKSFEEVDNQLDYAEVMEVAKDLAAEREWVYFSEHYQNGKTILQIAKEQNVSKETVGGACRIVVAKLRRYYNVVSD